MGKDCGKRIGILASIVVPNVRDMTSKANVSAIKSNVRNLQTAVDTYRLNNNGKKPTMEMPTETIPQPIDFKQLDIHYIHNEPEVGKYLVDYNGTVWASTIDSPTGVQVDDDEDKITWDDDPEASAYNIYELEGYKGAGVIGTANNKVKYKYIKTVQENFFQGEENKAYVVSAIDEFGFESAPSGVGYIGYEAQQNVVRWITIQRYEQLIDAGKSATWLEPNIDQDTPNGTRILYKYSSSDDQETWSEEIENLEEVPKARYLKIIIETQRMSNVNAVPKVLNIAPTYQVDNKVVQVESITRYNEKINFNNYKNIIYVDPVNGDDNNTGLATSPLKSVDSAYNKATNGDLLYLKEGTHIFKVGTLTKQVDFYGLNEKTVFVLNGPYQRPFNDGWGYLKVDPTANSGFYNMIVETRGSNTNTNFAYNRGTLAFYNTVFRNFFNLDYTDFTISYGGSLYLYNVTVDDTAARNLFVRLSPTHTGTLVFQNVYGKITLDNTYSSRKIDISVLKDSMIVNKAQLDANYNITQDGWRNTGLGRNPDGSKSHIGVYGGPNAWE